MKLYILMIVFTYFVVFDHNLINANNIIEGLEIYNMQSSDKYLAIEYKKNINNKFYHYISLYDTEKEKLIDIYNDDGELINDDMYFPSISKDGRYIVFTSRASNIISETMLKCYDIYEGVNKICNSVYIYDTMHEKFFIVKYNGNMLNGDSYVAKISGNGNYIVFESIASNLINANHDCSDLNGIKMCINIYKYNFLNDNIQLISSGLDGSGSNRNSISPTIDYEGRYVTYQSNSSNIVQMSSEYNYCINTYTNLTEPCTNIYLIDTLKQTTRVISKGINYVLNNHSINATISQNGMFVAYESYATNIFETVNYKKHIILYDLNENINKLITVSNNVLNNRDNHLESISYDGKYVLYRTTATNLSDNQNVMELYICNTTNFKTSIIAKNYHDVLLGVVQNNNVYFYNDEMIVSQNMADIQPPQISKNQSVYILKSDLVNVINKINVIDNLSDKNNIKIYLDKSLIIGEGIYNIDVTAIDEFGNRSSSKVLINVLEEDLEGPIFSNVSNIKILKGSSELNLYTYISAIDKIDGDVRIFVIDDGGLNLDKIGSYTIKLKATDNSNNSEYADILVTVYDNYNFSFFYEILITLTLLLGLIFLLIKVK